MNDERGTREESWPRAGEDSPAVRRDGVPHAGVNGQGSPPGTPHRGGSPPPAQDRHRHGRGRRRKARSWWVELPILVAFALVLALLIKSFVVQAFFIPSSSMEDTLLIGDKVLVNKLVYDFRPIHRGDIVVFNGEGSWDPAPATPTPTLERFWNAVTGLFGTAPGVHDYIKRVIGVPGDHVACCNARGQLTVNGVALSEKPYLYPGNAPSATPFRVTVPPGELWVMGDHRSISYDSRGHRGDPGGGAIPEDSVVGRAFLIVWPVSRWRVLNIPATFEQPRLAAAAGSSRPGAAGAMAAAAAGATGAAPARPGTPVPPLALGFAGAVPLTLLQRRTRRPLGRRLGGLWRALCWRAGGRWPERLRPGRRRGAGRGRW